MVKDIQQNMHTLAPETTNILIAGELATALSAHLIRQKIFDVACAELLYDYCWIVTQIIITGCNGR